jgi:hypothetical protein
VTTAQRRIKREDFIRGKAPWLYYRPPTEMLER